MTLQHVVYGDQDGIRYLAGMENICRRIKRCPWAMKIRVGDVYHAASAKLIRMSGQVAQTNKETIPSHFPVTIHSDHGLLARLNILCIPLNVPCKYWAVDEIVFCLVRLKDRQLSLCKRLLGWGNRRIVESEMYKVDREGRDILQRDADGGSTTTSEPAT